MNISSPSQSDKTPPADTTPLIVDLDGTLICGDTLWESFFSLPRFNLNGFLKSCGQLLQGRAAFKKSVADYYVPTSEDLNFNEEVVAFVQQEAAHRPVILATAADERIAHQIAEDMGLFAGVIASTANRNTKGATKLEAIKEYLKEHDLGDDFDYIGDSTADRPLWRAARQVYVVAPDEATAQALAPGTEIAHIFPQPRADLIDFVKAARPHQWVKNILIFLPVFLSHQFFSLGHVTTAAITFLSFSLTASATYIWNDIVDVHADRAHVRKRHRPLAASLVSIPAGLGFSLVLLLSSFALALLIAKPMLLLMLIGYIAITLSYSLYFKEKLIVDVMILGLLYAYRIILGGVATGIVVSDWLIAFSVFFFLSLAMVKRYSEIASKANTTIGKIKGRGYYTGDREVISMLGIASGFISILIMSLYLTSLDVIVLYTRPDFLWIVCLALIYWVSRIWVLVHRNHMPDDPIVFAIKDRNSILCGVICVAAILISV